MITKTLTKEELTKEARRADKIFGIVAFTMNRSAYVRLFKNSFFASLGEDFDDDDLFEVQIFTEKEVDTLVLLGSGS